MRDRSRGCAIGLPPSGPNPVCNAFRRYLRDCFDHYGTVTVDHGSLHTSSDYCVYDGWKMKGWPVATWVRGTQVMKDNAITAQPGLGRWLRADVAPTGARA